MLKDDSVYILLPGGEDLIYEVIVKRETEQSRYADLSYEDALRIMIEHLLSDEQAPIAIRRRCCSSVHEQTMSVDICNTIRKLAGTAEGTGDDVRIRLDNAVNNWYLRGKISLSDEDLTVPFDCCRTE